jgi:hypothetical protein
MKTEEPFGDAAPSIFKTAAGCKTDPGKQTGMNPEILIAVDQNVAAFSHHGLRPPPRFRWLFCNRLIGTWQTSDLPAG